MASYFKNLNYTMGDEDAKPEMRLLPERSNHVMAVADSGSRVIPLLAKNPRKITCVDINVEQLAVCEMRIALLRHCDLQSYKGFLGYDKSMSPDQRKNIFKKLAIEADRKRLLHEMFEHIRWESMLYFGKFEQMLQTLAKLSRFLIGRGAVGIFSSKNMEEQLWYYKNHFPHFRWKIVLFLLGNSTALNSLLYKGDFPKKNIPGSHFLIYKKIFHRLFTEFPVKNSFFLQMIFLGRVEFKEGYLIECTSEVFDNAKRALQNCEMKFVHDDIFSVVRRSENVDFVSLSDVPSFANSSEEAGYLERIKPGLAKGAIVAVRAHLRIIRPKIEGFLDISDKYTELTKNESTQLWSFHLYQYQ